MERVSDALGAIEVLDIEGKPHRMSDLWRDRPVLIMWVRHFG
jgi:hypothetical protein